MQKSLHVFMPCKIAVRLVDYCSLSLELCCELNKVTPRLFYLAVYAFEPDISKQERAAIHEMCRKMGMLSKSSG
jgi:hypothetical protein